MSLSSVQQAQLPCARSNSFLDHKSKTSRSSTTTWRRGRSTRTSLLLRVCVHPQFHFTHRQLLQCTSLLPRAHRIETEAALRDHGNCKLSCFVPLSVSVYCLLLKVLVGCLAKNFDLISSEPNRKIGHILWKTQYLIVASMWSKYMILKGNVSAVPGGQREKLWREFFSDPSQWWDHRAEKVTEHHSCQSSHVNVAIALVGINLVCVLVVAILMWSKPW